MLSVIIPVYNVEAYIAKCAECLMSQTLEDIEYIFVDDGSSDDSLSVLNSVIDLFPYRKKQVKVIRHDGNKGVAAARTTGMRAMTGDYMAHCDADDWVTPEAYRLMYEIAKRKGADIVSCRYVSCPSDVIRGPSYSGTGIGALKSSGFTYALWDKLISVDLIRRYDIYPYPGINYNEDLALVVRALCHAKKVIGLKEAYYYHTENREDSICSADYRRLVLNNSVKCLSLLDDYIAGLRRSTGDRRFSLSLTDPIKFWMKQGFYTFGDYRTWRILWPESRNYIYGMSAATLKEKLLMLAHAYDRYGLLD